MKTRKTEKQLQAQCDRWNERFSVGTEVAYYPVMNDKAYEVRKTQSTAYVLSGHTAVLFLLGKAGCVSLDHCAVIQNDRGEAA